MFNRYLLICIIILFLLTSCNNSSEYNEWRLKTEKLLTDNLIIDKEEAWIVDDLNLPSPTLTLYSLYIAKIIEADFYAQHKEKFQNFFLKKLAILYHNQHFSRELENEHAIIFSLKELDINLEKPVIDSLVKNLTNHMLSNYPLDETSLITKQYYIQIAVRYLEILKHLDDAFILPPELKDKFLQLMNEVERDSSELELKSIKGIVFIYLLKEHLNIIDFKKKNWYLEQINNLKTEEGGYRADPEGIISKIADLHSTKAATVILKKNGKIHEQKEDILEYLNQVIDHNGGFAINIDIEASIVGTYEALMILNEIEFGSLNKLFNKHGEN